ncbi:MarR family winged helix-turn-helix transcriptional regulator [Janibacter massiliensis]|uniref:MarR family winged helix-turn-helix transcriptional regulator n=1 Tax=Janibacter massiliensis TaxID=2058291 RepID=UPI000D112042|nr:MarR family transcriptional regulator [Janibacter massiliensis]
MNPPASESLAVLQRLTQVAASVRPAVAKKAGLGLHELRVLELIYEEPRTPGELAKELTVTSAAVSGIVDRLAARGHVDRQPHPTDGRRTEIHISETGKAEVVALLRPMFERLRTIDAELSDDEREVVLRYMRSATEAFRQVL